MADAVSKPSAPVKPPPPRPKRTPLEMAEYFYDQQRLHFWLFVLSLLLLASCVAMVFYDTTPEVFGIPFNPKAKWRVFARAFEEIEYERALREKPLVEEQIRARNAEIEELQQALRREEERIRTARMPLDPAEKEIRFLREQADGLRAEAASLSGQARADVEACLPAVLPVLEALSKGEKPVLRKAETAAAAQKFRALYDQAKLAAEGKRRAWVSAGIEAERVKESGGDARDLEKKAAGLKQEMEDALREAELRRRLSDLAQGVQDLLSATIACAQMRQDVGALRSEIPNLPRALREETEAAVRFVAPLVESLSHGRTYGEWEQELNRLLSRWESAKFNAEKGMDEYNSARWFLDEWDHKVQEAKKDPHHPTAALEEEAAHYRRVYEEKKLARQVRRRVFELLERLREEISAVMGRILRRKEELEADRAKIVKDREDLRKRLVHFESRPMKSLRGTPPLDFFDDPIKIRQEVLPDLLVDLNFARVRRIDRCTTCHLGADNPAFEAVAVQENGEKHYRFVDPVLQKIVERKFSESERQGYIKMFMAHPRLELHVGSNSPHPLKRFGCTICHGGDGQELDFSLAVHTPNHEEQAKDWKKRYGYYTRSYSRNDHHLLWGEPMLPTRYIESSCRKCHSEQSQIDGAPRYNEGMVIYERAGCYACHKTDSYPMIDNDLPRLPSGVPDESRRARRPGPPLTSIRDKVTKEWAFNWLVEPRRFRPTTRMPHFFRQSNSRGVADAADPTKEYGPIETENVMAAAAIEFIFSRARSDPRLQAPPGRGDAARGRMLFANIGCTACHRADEDYPSGTFAEGTTYSPYLEEFGPNLAGVGEKMNRAWLFQWLKNPRHYMPQTRMPQMRRPDRPELEDSEALDLVEYLIGLKIDNARRAERGIPAWEPGRPPLRLEGDRVVFERPEDEKILEGLTFEWLKRGSIEMAARDELRAMDPRQRVLFLGEKVVRNFGCYSCHLMEGFENLTGIGVELTGPQPFGSKMIERLAFNRTKYDGTLYPGISFEHPITKRPYRQRDPENPEPEVVRVHVTRWDFLRNKLLDPRVFDAGMHDILQPDEFLRMPNFNFTREEAERVTTFVLSFTHHEVRGLIENAKKKMTSRDHALARGARLLRDYNCKGCHVLQEERFEIRWTHPDPKGKLVDEWVWVEGRRKGEEKEVAHYSWLADLGRVPRSDEDPKLRYLPPVVRGGTDEILSRGDTKDHAPALPPGRYYRSNPNDPTELSPVRSYRPREGGDAHDRLWQTKKEYAGAFGIKGSDPSEFSTRTPPGLRTQGVKVQPDWLYGFLMRPSPIRPQFYVGRYLPEGRASLDALIDEKIAEIEEDGEVEGMVQEIVDAAQKTDAKELVAKRAAEFRGRPSRTVKDFEAWGKQLRIELRQDEPNFRMPTFQFTSEEASSLVRYFYERDRVAGVDTYPHVDFPERDPELLGRRRELHETVAANMALPQNCAMCHYIHGTPPPKYFSTGPSRHSFGPELANVPARLRSRWLDAFLRNPDSVHPGGIGMVEAEPMLRMGASISYDDAIRAGVEILQNFDRREFWEECVGGMIRRLDAEDAAVRKEWAATLAGMAALTPRSVQTSKLPLVQAALERERKRASQEPNAQTRAVLEATIKSLEAIHQSWSK